MTWLWLSTHGKFIDQIGISCDSQSDDINKDLGRGYGGHVAVTTRAFERIHRLNSEQGLNIKVKLNTVVMRCNMHEDWSSFILSNKVQRWKVFKILKIEGENDQHYDELKISDEEFSNFVKRHSHLDAQEVVLAPENNDAMTNSYIMISPDGQFYQNLNGRYTRSKPILDVGVEVGLSQVGFSYTKFQSRGGAYTI